MITANLSDRASLDAAMAKFSQAIALVAEQSGRDCKIVVAEQASLLADEMLKRTPPLNRARTKEKIKRDVLSKFGSLNVETSRESPSSGVHWYAFQPNAIFGVAADRDMTKASAQDLYDVYYKTKLNKQERIKAGQRGKQTVWLWQKIQSKTATVNALIKRLQGHVDRAKASWLPAWTILKSLAPVGAGAVPDSIAKHASGALGTFTNGLETPGAPSFTLTSFAKGIGSDKMRAIAAETMRIRAEKMVQRLVYVTIHPPK
jgi:hypothetical protein